MLDKPFDAVLNKIKELLNANPNNPTLFSTEGFNPSTFNSVFSRPRNNLSIDQNSNEEYALSLEVLNTGNVNNADTLTVKVIGTSNLEKIKLTAGNSNYPIVYLSNTENDTAIFSIPLDTAIDGSLFIMAQGYDTTSYVVENHTIQYVQPLALLDSIRLNNDSLKISVDEPKRIYITGFYNNDIERDIAYPMNLIVNVADTSILTVDSNLVIRPKILGQTNISVSFEGREDILNVSIGNAQEFFNSNFSIENLSICQGSSIQYTNKTRGNATYEWIFEGGTPQTSNEKDPTVSYTEPGKYSVTLISHFSSASDTLYVDSLIEVGVQNRTINSGSWNNLSTWGCRYIPAEDDSVVIASGNIIILDSTVRIRKLNIEWGGVFMVNDSSKTLTIGDETNKISSLRSNGSLKITNGKIHINGSVKMEDFSSFDMRGGNLSIDGNTGEPLTSIPDGDHLFDVASCMNSFNFSGGTLQIINPPLGINSQAINCLYPFGASSTVLFGDGISTIPSNNPNGFGGSLLPMRIGRLLLDAATRENNRVFKNLNELIITNELNIISGHVIQNSGLKILKGITDTIITAIDGGIYHAVQIGNQIWAQENLSTTKYANGDDIPHPNDLATFYSLTTGAYMSLPDDNGTGKYGRRYNWYAAVDARGICPTGWHIPSDEEWGILEKSLGLPSDQVFTIGVRGNSQNIGGKLKALCPWSIPNTGATNIYGFNGVPFNALSNDYFSVMRTSTASSETIAITRSLFSTNGGIDREHQFKSSGAQCRCLKDPMVIPLPGNVRIGNQIWMTKNLSVVTYRNGDTIPQITDSTEWANLTTGAWRYYNDNSTNEAVYGRLYNWFAVNDPRGLAPLGMHIPTDQEWTLLSNHLGGESIAGGALKTETGWQLPNTGATNSSGFNGLPAGLVGPSSVFGFKGGAAFWWSTTESSPSLGICRTIYFDSEAIYKDQNSAKNLGISIRCVQD